MAEEEEQYNEEIFESIGDEAGEHKEEEEELPEISSFKEQIAKIPSRFPDQLHPGGRHESSFTISAKNDENYDIRITPSNKNNVSEIGSSYREESNVEKIGGEEKDSFEVKYEESLKNFLDPENESNIAYSEICDSNVLRSSLKLKIQQQMQNQHQLAGSSMRISNNKMVDSMKVDSTSNISKQSIENRAEDKETVISYSSNMSNENNSLSYSVSRNPSAMPHSKVSHRLSKNGNGEGLTSPKALQEVGSSTKMPLAPPQLKDRKVSSTNPLPGKDDTKKGPQAEKKPAKSAAGKKPLSDPKQVPTGSGAAAEKKNAIRINRPSSAAAKPITVSNKKADDSKQPKNELKTPEPADQGKKPPSEALQKQGGSKSSGNAASSVQNIRISKPVSAKPSKASGSGGSVSKDNYMDFLKKKMEHLNLQKPKNEAENNTNNIPAEIKNEDNLFEEAEVAGGDQALPDMMNHSKPKLGEGHDENNSQNGEEAVEKLKELENENKATPDDEVENSPEEKEKNATRNKLQASVEKIKKQNKGDLHKVFVKKINDSYKQKMQKMQEKEDELFVTQELEKKKLKPANATSEDPEIKKKEKNWVVRPLATTTAFGKPQPVSKKNDELLNEAAKKVGKKGVAEAPEPEKQENAEKIKSEKSVKNQESEVDAKSQTQKSETLKKGWNYPVGEGVETENEKTKKRSEAAIKKKENDYNLSEKKSKMKKGQEDLLLLKKIREKEKEYAKEREANQIKENKALTKVNNLLKEPAEPKKNITAEIYNEESVKEREAQNTQLINTLKVEMKQIMLQNQKIDKATEEVRKRREQITAKVNELKKASTIIELPGNKFITFGQVPTLASNPAKLKGASGLLEGGNSVQNTSVEGDVSLLNGISEEAKAGLSDASAVESFIKKIDEEGFTLEDVFKLLDKDGDGFLTTKEIRENMGKLKWNIEKEEIEEFLGVIDKNTDGVVTLEEWSGALQSILASHKDYGSIMGQLKDITNPIILEERILDLGLRKKIVEKLLLEEERKDSMIKVEFAAKKEELEAFEEQLKKRAMRNRPSFDSIKKELEVVSLEVARLESEKKAAQNQQNDLIKNMEENIRALTEDLKERSERVLREKENLYKEKNELQKLQIKLISYNKFVDKLEENLRERNLNEAKLAKNMQDNLAINILKNKKKGKDIIVFCVIKLQRILRGCLSRKKTEAYKKKRLGAKLVILYHYRAYRKRNHKKKGYLLSERLEDLLRSHCFQHGFRRIKERSWRVAREREDERKRKEREEQKRKKEMQEKKEAQEREQQMKTEESARSLEILGQELEKSLNTQLNLLEEDEVKLADQAAYEAPRSPIKMPAKKPSIMKSKKPAKIEIENRLTSPKKSITTKVSMDREISSSPVAKQPVLAFTPQVLAASLTIQRNYRVWRKFKPTVLRTYFADISENCPACNLETVKKVCRKCKLPCFCNKCFKKFHAGAERRNHRFFNLNLEIVDDADFGENIEANIEELKKIIDKNKFKSLRETLETENIYEIGLMEVKKFEGILSRGKFLFSDPQISLILRVAEKECMLSKKDLIKRLEEKGKHEGIDKNKKYIDLLSFYMLIAPEAESPE